MGAQRGWLSRCKAHRRGTLARWDVVLPARSTTLALLLALCAALLAACGGGGDDARSDARTTPAVTAEQAPIGDPLAWSPERSDDDAKRAAEGLAHVLYAKSPGGAPASAARTAAFRDDVEQAAERHGQDPDVLEAIVLLESAGRPEAQAGDLEGAVGLTQILAETGQSLLAMRIDLAASARFARRTARAERRGRGKTVRRLRAQRRRVDERFDPAKALDAAARYLAISRERLGRDDLAVVGYHMGIGNVQTALARFGEGTVPYAELFFASTPLRHRAAFQFLRSLGDDSSTYLWRVRAARQIMRLHRDDPDELARRSGLQIARNSAEQVLHPPDRSVAYATPDDLERAYEDGDIVKLPTAYLALHGVSPSPKMGELAKLVKAPRSRYRGLRREALATLAYLGARVKAISGARRPLFLTSTVRDARYQEALLKRNVQAVADYSLHTTGFAFDFARDYSSRSQAEAVQFVLDRLTALNLIAYVVEPGAIHVTVAKDAERLMEPLGVRAAP